MQRSDLNVALTCRSIRTPKCSTRCLEAHAPTWRGVRACARPGGRAQQAQQDPDSAPSERRRCTTFNSDLLARCRARVSGYKRPGRDEVGARSALTLKSIDTNIGVFEPLACVRTHRLSLPNSNSPPAA
jgi:hypothetical protein